MAFAQFNQRYLCNGWTDFQFLIYKCGECKFWITDQHLDICNLLQFFSLHMKNWRLWNWQDWKILTWWQKSGAELGFRDPKLLRNNWFHFISGKKVWFCWLCTVCNPAVTAQTFFRYSCSRIIFTTLVNAKINNAKLPWNFGKIPWKNPWKTLEKWKGFPVDTLYQKKKKLWRRYYVICWIWLLKNSF